MKLQLKSALTKCNVEIASVDRPDSAGKAIEFQGLQHPNIV